jgi:phospholipid transport system substrate-binding protein
MPRFRAHLLGLASLLLATAVTAADPPASQVIARLNAALLDTLKNAEQLGYQGRFDKLAPVVPQAFDVEFMAEKSIGKYWKSLSDADKARWLALFKEFTVANYAGNLDKFTGQRFEMSGEEPDQNDTIVVHTKLINPGGEDVELNYRLHQTPAGPRIVDIYLKGTVSELALRRSDYTSALERDGFDALVATIRTKIADLAAGRAKR